MDKKALVFGKSIIKKNVLTASEHVKSIAPSYVGT